MMKKCSIELPVHENGITLGLLVDQLQNLAANDAVPRSARVNFVQRMDGASHSPHLVIRLSWSEELFQLNWTEE